jgi:hypothetical protein
LFCSGTVARAFQVPIEVKLVSLAWTASLMAMRPSDFGLEDDVQTRLH